MGAFAGSHFFSTRLPCKLIANGFATRQTVLNSSSLNCAPVLCGSKHPAQARNCLRGETQAAHPEVAQPIQAQAAAPISAFGDAAASSRPPASFSPSSRAEQRPLPRNPHRFAALQPHRHSRRFDRDGLVPETGHRQSLDRPRRTRHHRPDRRRRPYRLVRALPQPRIRRVLVLPQSPRQRHPLSLPLDGLFALCLSFRVRSPSPP